MADQNEDDTKTSQMQVGFWGPHRAFCHMYSLIAFKRSLTETFAAMDQSHECQFNALAAEKEFNWPETTRQLVALYQIRGAITHFNRKVFECVITLAAAAEGIMPDVEDVSLFELLKQRQDGSLKKLDVNFVQNWLKHGKFNGVEIESMQITPFFAVFSLQRAITKFVAVYGGETPQMAKFMNLCKSLGYPTPTKHRRQPRLRPVSSQPPE
ncbi:MAG TPA: hypothetical protein VFQ82_09130 [Stellaceae bacterium]|nr:hypothetical protein [Stellaceae bacterium]